MKTLGNILWNFPFFGFVTATLVLIFGVLLTITVVAAPIGQGLIQHGLFLYWPFGHAMVDQKELNIPQNPAWKVYSTILMILWIPFGIVLCLGAIVQVVGCCISLIGIPAAIVVAKSLGTFFNPVGKKCVPQAVADELERRKATEVVKAHLG